ncbi:alpha-amylase family protein [Kineococcus indalonis]|uniref:hypothetical protein n=1 Tax=Kineococcus indalonis TaxID=2696566 RepID=UPI00141378BF|nr:hypothetical protein [Kineococcus indalonis]NAZ86718.1 hypothetical protein [Kineococcus indalonis]
MPFAPTQEGVLAHARGLLDAGVPPGALLIDDCWAQDYGTWRFERARFPDPAAVVAELRGHRPEDVTASGGEPVDLTEAWARVGLRYPFNEYRACWRTAGQPLAQRLHDEPPARGPEGIESLVPGWCCRG